MRSVLGHGSSIPSYQSGQAHTVWLLASEGMNCSLQWAEQ